MPHRERHETQAAFTFQTSDSNSKTYESQLSDPVIEAHVMDSRHLNIH